MSFTWTDIAFKKWWYRMGEIFGKDWYEKNGPEPSPAWQEVLTTFSVETVRKIFAHYLKSGDAFPPNLAQVVKLSIDLNHKPAHVAIPPPVRIPDQISKHITKIRAQLCGKIRSILRPNESYTDYLREWHASNLSKLEFTASRLHANGWTADDELAFQNRAHALAVHLPDGDKLISALERVAGI